MTGPESIRAVFEKSWRVRAYSAHRRERRPRPLGGYLQSVLVAGGGFRCGQVIGSSTSKGEVPRDRRLRSYDGVATIFHHLAINTQQSFNNLAGRPIPVLAEGEPIRELL